MPSMVLLSPPCLHLPRDAQMLMEDVKRIVHELDQGQQLSSIGVELVDNELAILYMNSKKSEVTHLLLLLLFASVAHGHSHRPPQAPFQRPLLPLGRPVSLSRRHIGAVGSYTSVWLGQAGHSDHISLWSQAPCNRGGCLRCLLAQLDRGQLL